MYMQVDATSSLSPLSFLLSLSLPHILMCYTVSLLSDYWVFEVFSADVAGKWQFLITTTDLILLYVWNSKHMSTNYTCIPVS